MNKPVSDRIHRLAPCLVLLCVLIPAGWFWWCGLYRSDVSFLPREAPAEWIVYPSLAHTGQQPNMEMATIFKRSFSLRAIPAHASLQVKGFRNYTIAINSMHIPDHQRPGTNWKVAERLDISRALRSGSNEIVVCVSNATGPPALWLASQAGGLHVNSDETWECSYAEAEWRPARLAGKPKVAPAGNPTSTSEEPWPSLRARWPTLLLFAALAATIYWMGTKTERLGLTGVRLRWLEMAPLVGVVGMWLVLFANNLGRLSPWVGYDAGEHLDYINYIQTHHSLPLASDGWEMFQPPLYYLFGAAVLEALGLKAAEPGASTVLRVVGFGIGVVHIAIVWATLRLLFPGERAKSCWGLLLAAFLPPMIYLSQYVTNETLAATLVSACFYLTLRLLKRERAQWKDYAALGLCFGAALLTKSSTLLALPVVVGGIAWKAVERPHGGPQSGQNEKDADKHDAKSAGIRWQWGLVLMLGVCLAVCGWHYGRVWLRFGSPLVGNWNPKIGYGWWQDDGYRTSSYYLRFGGVLHHPWFAAYRSFADGLYSTLWGDGLFGGLGGGLDRPPWNHDLMAAGYWLALPLMLTVLAGGFVAVLGFGRQPRAEWLMALALSFLVMLALVQFALAIPSNFNVKAFYGLSALIPFCAFGALGLEALAASWRPVRPVLAIAVGLWALNSYASFWIYPASPSAAIINAKSMVREGRVSEAAPLLEEVLQREPGNADVRSLQLWVLTTAGDFDRAGTQAEFAARNHPNHAGVQFALANLFAQRGQMAPAIEHARRAMELAPGDAHFYEFLAMLLAKQGRYDEAAEVSRTGLRVDPASGQLRFALGLGLLIHGATNADAQLELAFRLQPHLPGAHAMLGAVLAAAGKLEQAASNFSEAIALHPDDFQLHCQLAMVFGLQQKTALAIEEYAETLRLKPDCVEALNNLAWIRAANIRAEFRNGAEAVQLAEHACQLTGYAQPTLMGTLAAAYAETGRFDEAVTTATKARALAMASGQKDLAEKNQRLIEMFVAHQAYRELTEPAKEDRP